MSPHETTEERYILEIVQDEDPMSPDDWDRAFSFVHWHRRGFIGESIIGREKEWYEEHLKAHHLIIPLFLYEHSGQTIWIGKASSPALNDPWDSGQVGFIWASKEMIEKLVGPLSPKSWKRVGRRIARQEVKEWDQYLTGDVWEVVIRDTQNDNEVVESCCGFYGHEYAKQEGEAMLKSIQETQHLLPLEVGA